MPSGKISVSYLRNNYWAPLELRQKGIVVLGKGLALRITGWADGYNDPIAEAQVVIQLTEEQKQLSAEQLAEHLGGVVAELEPSLI